MRISEDCRIHPIYQGAGRKPIRHPNNIATFTVSSGANSWGKVWSGPVCSPVPHIITLVP